jgi:putative lipoic acid-binding regulatory protein
VGGHQYPPGSDALTNLFPVRNIGQVMNLKNELRDMKMNDDDNITSYFVRISQLRDQLQEDVKEFVKDHLIIYISHLDSSKKMYDALTNLFPVRNIGQVMNLKNELRDMKMNDDDNITSYFVRISQLRDQLQEVMVTIFFCNIALSHTMFTYISCVSIY